MAILSDYPVSAGGLTAERAGLSELALIAACFAPLLISVPAQTPIRFLGLMLWAPTLYHYRSALFAEGQRLAIIFLMPAVLALSLMWTSDFPAGLRTVGLILFGFVTVIAVVTRATFNQLIAIMFLASAAAALASYANPNSHNVYHGETAALGLYSQKNILGKRMMALCLLAAYMAVARGMAKPVRIVAICGAVLGFVLVIQSNSATALVLTSIGVFLVTASSGLLQGFSRLRGGLILFFLLGFMALAGLAYWASLSGLSPLEFVLNGLGKDPTLTGRTTLWGYGRAFIAEHPWLGSGVEGFWRPYRNEAVWIASTYSEPGTFRYYFHSSYLEYGVHTGIPGMVALGITHVFMAFVAARDLIRFRDPQGALTFALVGNSVIRSFTESDFYSRAEVNVLVPWIVVGFALKRNAERNAERKSAPPSDEGWRLRKLGEPVSSLKSDPDAGKAGPKPERLAVVIGAMRAGTTTLFQILQQTGLVSLTRIKEPDFFIEQKSAYRGADWYSSLYDDLSKVCVDISPNYAKNDVFPGVAKAIRDFNPKARIVYIVRDPVERAISEYFHQKAAGVEMPSPDALLSTPQGEHILSTSSYGKQIADYYALFPASQILIVDMDVLVGRPKDEVARILGFIGAPPPEDLAVTAEVTNDRGSLARMPKFWLSLRRTRAGDWIRGVVPPSLHSGLKALGTKVSGRRPEAPEPFPPSVKDAIRARLSDDLSAFAKLTDGQDLAWLPRAQG